MSINYCTLTNSSVDAFCGNQRAKILALLIPQLHPPKPVGAGAGTSQSKQWIHRLPPEKWEQPYMPTELERIVVRAKFQELSGEDAQDVKYNQDLVVVTDLSVSPTSVSVNIDSFKVN